MNLQIQSCDYRLFIKRHLTIPMVIMLPILFGFELTSWDVDFQQFFYNTSRRAWMLSNNGWAETYLHDRAKTLTHIYVNVCIVGLMLSIFKTNLKPFRKEFIFLILAVIFTTGIVAELKQVTNVWCPSQTTLFGGKVAYIKVFESRILYAKSGICWPSGHASAGFAFVSAYFVVRRYWPRYAVWSLMGGLSMGVFYGSVRILQGQHFLSHMLWSGIICWIIMVVLSMVIFKENRTIGSTSASLASNQFLSDYKAIKPVCSVCVGELAVYDTCLPLRTTPDQGTVASSKI